MKNTFGHALTVTLFGESHGPKIGAVLDGLPSGMPVAEDRIREMLSLRRPAGDISTARREMDDFRIVSGVYEGRTTGTPLTILIPNSDAKSGDYSETRWMARPGHADYTAFCKYLGFEDPRGGGHQSGRITAALAAAGALLMPALERRGIHIGTHIMSLGSIQDQLFSEDPDELIRQIESLSDRPFAVLDEEKAAQMQQEILKAKEEGDSIGGLLETAVTGLPAGLGEPWFDTMEGQLSHILFSIPGVKGVSFGDAFSMAGLHGSEYNDTFFMDHGKVRTRTNHNAGINGGITNGMPVVIRTAVKPTPSIRRPQESVDFGTMENIVLSTHGRHDPAIIHRARIVADSAVAVALADLLTLRYGTQYLAGDAVKGQENIVITGMSGAGKSEIGSMLKKILGWPLYDTDALIIQKAGMPIRKIFETVGEEGFRDLETEVIRSLEHQSGVVISTGGGAILRDENIQSLKKNGRIFFLRRPVEDIPPSWERPLADTREKVNKLYEERLPRYLQTADLVVDVTGSPEDTARQLLYLGFGFEKH